MLWLATAAYAADQLAAFGGSCHSAYFPSWWTSGCSETQAIVAFAFLTWIARTCPPVFFCTTPDARPPVLAYWVALLTISTISASNGASRVWYGSVKDAPAAPAAGKLGTMGTAENKPVAAGEQSYPPQATYHSGAAQV